MQPSFDAACGGCAKMCTYFTCIWLTLSLCARNVFIKQPATDNLNRLTENREVREELLIILTEIQ